MSAFLVFLCEFEFLGTAASCGPNSLACAPCQAPFTCLNNICTPPTSVRACGNSAVSCGADPDNCLACNAPNNCISNASIFSLFFFVLKFTLSELHGTSELCWKCVELRSSGKLCQLSCKQCFGCVCWRLLPMREHCVFLRDECISLRFLCCSKQLREQHLFGARALFRNIGTTFVFI